MRIAVILSVFLFVLYACSLIGEGTWSDSQGNSGSLASEFRLTLTEMSAGKEEYAVIYGVKFDDGSEIVVKFAAGAADEDRGKGLLFDFSGEVIGTLEERPATENSDEKIMIIEINDEKIELQVTANENHNDMDVVGKKTYQDGRTLTWKDTMRITLPSDF